MLKPHEQRVVDEKNELKDKVLKLDDFLLKGKPSFIDEHNWNLLESQLDVMTTYLDILEERISLFKVEV